MLVAISAVAAAIGIFLAIRAIVGEPPRTAVHVTASPASSAKTAAPVAVSTPVQIGGGRDAGVDPPDDSTPPADDDVMRALAGKPPRKPGKPAAVRKPAGNYELHLIDGFALVRLGGGAPTIKPFGGPSKQATRTVTGRVLDRSGQPLANAIVLADLGFDVERGNVMTIGSAITDASGAFTLTAPAGSFVLALLRDDWSEIVRAGDEPVELRITGHGALAGRFTYSGEPETFRLRVEMQGKPFTGNFDTDTDGTITIPSLPPGRHKVSVGLVQSFGGGHSQTLTREVTIVDGKTAQLELAFNPGTTVVLLAKPPAGATPKGITYWLFTGRAPRDGAEARARKQADGAPSFTLGAGAKFNPAEFHDVAPGAYVACAAFFDIVTMDAFDKPFGCRAITVVDGESVRELEIPLAE